MTNRLTILGTILIIAFYSCGQRDPNKQIEEGNVKGELYTSNEIGWTIEIPKGWKIMSKDKIKAGHKKGMELIEKTAQSEIDVSQFKQLIHFQKDQFNIFQSTSESFNEEYDGEWEINNKYIQKLLYDTYVNQGIKVDTSSTFVLIDNLKFSLFKIKMYDPKGNLILNQDAYTRLINGFQFGVIINYNNETDKETLMNVWGNSKFRK